MDQSLYCSAPSLEAGEPLYGSAPRTDVWLMLEENGPWGAKALPESRLPDAVKARLSGWLGQIPRARLQLIRRRHVPAQAHKTFFVALLNDTRPTLYRVPLAAYEDLLALDLAALLAGNALEPERGALFLACGNARRDKCCGKFGPPVYQRFAEHAGEAAWECTHIGGHRFAATALCFPQGLSYGRLAPDVVGQIVREYDRERIVLEHYRGRACYDAPAQAAEYFLRSQTGERALGAYHLLDTQALAPQEWQVRFASAGGDTHTLRIVQEPAGTQTYESCKAAEPVEVMRFRAVAA